MLTAIRDKATGWIAWVIVTLITIPFALWGINSYFEGGAELSVAKVNGNEISAYTYQQDLARQRQILSQQTDGNFDPALLNSPGARRQVLDSLIDNQLLNQFTADKNFRFSDAQLTRVIQNYPAFQSEGKFDPELYQQTLRANQFTPQSFEQYQRIDGVVGQLRAGISDSAFVTNFELNRILQLQEQRRTASYAIIETGRFTDAVDVSETEVQSYYDQNVERFSSESRIKVDYIELSIDSLSRSIVPAESEIESQYAISRGRYTSAESRQASHILISVSETDTDDEKSEKRNLAAELADKARMGEDFAELASEHSDDPGSALNGGDLGAIARGQMVKPFEDAVYSMALGEIAGPVETQFGYHVIKLTSLTEAREQTLDEVRDEVEEEVRRAGAEELFSELAESFKNLVFENPEDISIAARALDLDVMTSDWFTIDRGDGVAADGAVRRAAFAEDVLNENLVSQAIEIGFDKLISVQKASYEAQAPIPLDSIKQEVEDAIRLEKSQAEALTLGSDLLARLESGDGTSAAWNDVVQEHNLETRQLAENRADIADDLSLLADSLFSHAAPRAGMVEFGGAALEDGNYALYALEKVERGDPENADEANKTAVRQRLLAREGDSVFVKFQQSLRKNAEIEIFEEQL